MIDFLAIVSRFSQTSVAVIGDIVLDCFEDGEVRRISPEAPVPVFLHGKTHYTAGGCGNTAANLAALGCKVTCLSVVGDDEDADYLEQLLINAGVQPSLVRLAGVPTIKKTRYLSGPNHILRSDVERAPQAYAEGDMTGELEKLLPEIDILVISDYAKGAVLNSKSLIDRAKKANIRVIVDPKGANFSRYAGAYFITPNLKEFEEVAGHAIDEADLEARALEMAKTHNVENVLVTRGALGMSLVDQGGNATHIPAKQVEVFDVVGAGDTVVACLAGALAAGAKPKLAVELANQAGSIAVSRHATVTVSALDMLKVAEQAPVVNATGQEQFFSSLKKSADTAGERIVFTNGCFDILHAGHLKLLCQARAFGDFLVVGLNDDASVRRLKGVRRPINSLEQRAATLSMLPFVDLLIVFSEDTPAALIREVMPNILVKGGDYIAEDIVGFEDVTKNGGSVKIIPLLEGFSTTNIVDKIGLMDS